MKIRLGIFASGNGSNAINLNRYFQNHSHIEVSKIYCNNPVAGVITKSFSNDIPCHIFTKSQLQNDSLLEQLIYDRIDVIVLAGFLWLIPSAFVKQFPDKIINIHPALLPKFGGKGMYGMRVHEAVIDGGEKQSGITIHKVDDKYDNGDMLFQAHCTVDADDTADSLAQKIHLLEYEHFPKVVEEYCLRMV
ncbi:MAG: phosphoribosylglycinamide formyltransferase [Flavobacteriales bacterium]|nr:phosphoribosylglycinamide formyltransferase [Flavobacteriales bacterium]